MTCRRFAFQESQSGDKSPHSIRFAIPKCLNQFNFNLHTLQITTRNVEPVISYLEDLCDYGKTCATAREC